LSSVQPQNEPHKDESQPTDYQQDRHKPLGVTVGEALDFALPLLRFPNEVGDLPQLGIVADLHRANFQNPELIERARKDFIADGFVNGNGLTCQGRLIDRRATGDDDAINRNPFAGTNDDNIADLDLLKRNFRLITAPLDSGSFRGKFQQLLQSAVGFCDGVMLQCTADEHDEDDFGSGEVFAKKQGSDGSEGNSKVSADAPMRKQLGKRLVKNPPAADDGQQNGSVQIRAGQGFKDAQRIEQNPASNHSDEGNFSPTQLLLFITHANHRLRCPAPFFSMPCHS